MNDIFTELVVERKPQPMENIVRVGLILLAVLTAFAGLFVSPVLLTAFIISAALIYFVFPRLKVEYEYSYVNGEIDIAAIYSKQSRKELTVINLNEAECIAPLGSHFLDSYGSTYAVVDYSAKDPQNRPYVVVEGGEKQRKIILQMNDEMIEDLKYRMPMKVHQD